MGQCCCSHTGHQGPPRGHTHPRGMRPSAAAAARTERRRPSGGTPSGGRSALLLLRRAAPGAARGGVVVQHAPRPASAAGASARGRLVLNNGEPWTQLASLPPVRRPERPAPRAGWWCGLGQGCARAACIPAAAAFTGATAFTIFFGLVGYLGRCSSAVRVTRQSEGPSQARWRAQLDGCARRGWSNGNSSRGGRGGSQTRGREAAACAAGCAALPGCAPAGAGGPLAGQMAGPCALRFPVLTLGEATVTTGWLGLPRLADDTQAGPWPGQRSAPARSDLAAACSLQACQPGTASRCGRGAPCGAERAPAVQGVHGEAREAAVVAARPEAALCPLDSSAAQARALNELRAIQNHFFAVGVPRAFSHAYSVRPGAPILLCDLRPHHGACWPARGAFCLRKAGV